MVSIIRLLLADSDPDLTQRSIVIVYQLCDLLVTILSSKVSHQETLKSHCIVIRLNYLSYVLLQCNR